MDSMDKSYNGGFFGNKGKYFAEIVKNVSTHVVDDRITFPGKGGNFNGDDSINPVTAKEGVTGREGNTPIDPGSKNSLKQ